MVLKTVIFAVWLVKRYMRKKHRSLTGRILPPEPGQQTTLVVTDVQVRENGGAGNAACVLAAV